MTTETAFNSPTPEILRKFLPLRDLSEEQLQSLSSLIEIEQLPAGRLLIKQGSQEEYSFFLVEGHIRLRAADGKISDVRDGDASAGNPISQLLPRHYDVISVTNVRFLRIRREQLDEIRQKSSSNEPEGVAGYEVSGDTDGEATDFENQLSFQFLQDLESDALELPSLPEVAIKIGKALEDKVSDAATIAEMIQTDPQITAKLIKASNSAMYGRRSEVETCTGAVIRLGTDVTHKLVLSFALKDLFKSDSSLLQQRMQELWKHSTHVAALCYVLAKHDNRFNPELAMLIGLLHDIGIVAVLNYARSFPLESRQPEVIDQACKRLRAQTGSLILRKWGFPTEFIIAALEAENWHRDKGITPDYCDLVIIAQLHSFVGTSKAFSAPAINEVPAHSRLALGELTPRLSLKILDEAKEQISHAISLLNI
ncbi:MAG: HDOD domain-containing protein [Gammaproteobacteria bacterium]|nr:HDOD domain-containing protein [Gammaproteobacteria bacterium]MCP5409516.1 HDOD domain-containing protein [Chromatiaceae bacterium]MCP5444788.1 HDOD domain-containing protein [Chromatiaceae bacterium]